jgi:hypothetical protein
VLTVALLVPATAATADPPTPYDPTPELFAAGEACDFPVSIVFNGKGSYNELPNNPQFAAIGPSPGLKATVTNLDNGDTVTVNASGAFRFVEQPDGSVIIRAGGHNFLYAALDIGVGVLSTTGPVTLRNSADGEFVAADVSGARVRDLCAELA